MTVARNKFENLINAKTKNGCPLKLNRQARTLLDCP